MDIDIEFNSGGTRVILPYVPASEDVVGEVSHFVATKAKLRLFKNSLENQQVIFDN